ncbi:MAG: hypothetical protein ASARMPREDX12_002009 [Alectoria sarmentosa]|nr:MAG: hypothetical protein ASARMPREDX12_002009 [Alectoria sarmentosa]
MFWTSILFTNRQVYNEASDIFYMENLFIRVNSVIPGPMFNPDALGDYKDDAGRSYGLPILSKGSKAQACTRHAMEIDLIAGLESYGHNRNHHLLLACDDLPMFCRALLLMGGRYLHETGRPQEIELWIIIGDEIGTAGENSAASDSFCDGKTAGYLTASTKNAAAHREGPIKYLRTAVEMNATLSQDTNGSGRTTLNVAMDAKPRMPQSPNFISSPRIRRLLEPFRAVYSVGFSYIDAPISERYRQEIQTSLSRARPSAHDLFLVVSSAYEEAMATFATADVALAIHKMRGTLDVWLDNWGQMEHDITTKVATGPFAGFSFGEAFTRIQFFIWQSLAQAHLKFHKDLKHVRAARMWVLWIIKVHTCCPVERVRHWRTRGHENAMVYYLEAEIWEALDQLGEHNCCPRSTALGDVVSMLTAALTHEPGNAMLEREQIRRRTEKKMAETMEELMEMETQMEEDEGKRHSRERYG